MMLVDLQRELRPGFKYTIELGFERAGSIPVDAEVKQP